MLAIICHKHIVLFAFDSRETLIQFEIKIRRSLGEGMTRINLGVVASMQFKYITFNVIILKYFKLLKLKRERNLSCNFGVK